MSTPSTVRVDYDLASRESSITLCAHPGKESLDITGRKHSSLKGMSQKMYMDMEWVAV